MLEALSHVTFSRPGAPCVESSAFSRHGRPCPSRVSRHRFHLPCPPSLSAGVLFIGSSCTSPSSSAASEPDPPAGTATRTCPKYSDMCMLACPSLSVPLARPRSTTKSCMTASASFSDGRPAGRSAHPRPEVGRDPATRGADSDQETPRRGVAGRSGPGPRTEPAAPSAQIQAPLCPPLVTGPGLGGFEVWAGGTAGWPIPGPPGPPGVHSPPTEKTQSICKTRRRAAHRRRIPRWAAAAGPGRPRTPERGSRTHAAPHPFPSAAAGRPAGRLSRRIPARTTP
jgi:hypothetical protein